VEQSKVDQAQSQLVHAQPALQPHDESHEHDGVQAQDGAQPQELEVVPVTFASMVVDFMRHLVFGLTTW
jgi:hypothetical protein